MALLTQRELDVLKLSFYERKDIAEKLCVAPHTIETHVYNYLKKLGARNRTEAIIIALKMGIVTLEDFEVDYDKGNEFGFRNNGRGIVLQEVQHKKRRFSFQSA